MASAEALVHMSAASVLAAFGGRGRVVPLTEGCTSWVVHVPGFWRLKKDQFEHAWSQHPKDPHKIRMGGKLLDTPRYHQAFGRDYKFSGQVSQSLPFEDFPEALEFRDRVNTALGCGDAYNGALVNWYDGAKDHYIGKHKDDERALVAGLPIFSMSWGQTRRFQLSQDKKIPRREAVDKLVLNLDDGDLVVMGGECQTTHTHEIMHLTKNEPRNRRINVTLRVFKEDNKPTQPAADHAAETGSGPGGAGKSQLRGGDDEEPREGGG